MLINKLVNERPEDAGSQHLRGWRMLRESRYGEAIEVFLKVLSQQDHVASFRDGAECYYRLGRTADALDLLFRGKQIESENPFIRDLEAQIYEEIGDYDHALEAALVASVRDPGSWSTHHRLARIYNKLGSRDDAITCAREAVRIAPNQFSSQATLVSLLLDERSTNEAERHLGQLRKLSIDDTQKHVVTHLHARLLYELAEYDRAVFVLQRQIREGANLAASYGLMVGIRIAQYADSNDLRLASASILLQQAKTALSHCKRQDDHDIEVVETLETRIAELEVERNRL